MPAIRFRDCQIFPAGPEKRHEARRRPLFQHSSTPPIVTGKLPDRQRFLEHSRQGRALLRRDQKKQNQGHQTVQ